MGFVHRLFVGRFFEDFQPVVAPEAGLLFEKSGIQDHDCFDLLTLHDGFDAAPPPAPEDVVMATFTGNRRILEHLVGDGL